MNINSDIVQNKNTNSVFSMPTTMSALTPGEFFSHKFKTSSARIQWSKSELEVHLTSTFVRMESLSGFRQQTFLGKSFYPRTFVKSFYIQHTILSQTGTRAVRECTLHYASLFIDQAWRQTYFPGDEHTPPLYYLLYIVSQDEQTDRYRARWSNLGPKVDIYEPAKYFRPEIIQEYKIRKNIFNFYKPLNCNLRFSRGVHVRYPLVHTLVVIPLKNFYSEFIWKFPKFPRAIK